MALNEKSHLLTRCGLLQLRGALPELTPEEELSQKLQELCLDEDGMFERALRDVAEEDLELVLSFLVLALVIDGRISSAEWLYFQNVCENFCEPRRMPSLPALALVRRHFVRGRPMQAQEFRAAFTGTPGQWQIVMPWHREFWCVNCVVPLTAALGALQSRLPALSSHS